MKINVTNKTGNNLVWPLSKFKSIYREKDGNPFTIEVDKNLIALFKKDHKKLIETDKEYKKMIKDKTLIVEFEELESKAE